MFDMQLASKSFDQCDRHLHTLADELPNSHEVPPGSTVPTERLRLIIVLGYVGNVVPNDIVPYGASVAVLRQIHWDRSCRTMVLHSPGLRFDNLRRIVQY